MKKIIETTLLEYDKSSFLIDFVQHDIGTLYVEITQKLIAESKYKQTIKINPSVLTDIIQTLQKYREKLQENQLYLDKYLTDYEQQKISTNYLKGVSIKDLSMQNDLSIELIEMILRNKGIEVVENGIIKKPKPVKYFRKRKRR